MPDRRILAGQVWSRPERHCTPSRCEALMKHVGQALVLLIIAAVPAYAGGVPVQVTPEPATIGLVATGISAIGAIALWRNRKH
jgi:hypothetical protein